jgi:hypothetical protein
MTDFDTALDDCLKRMSSGEADVEACLALYPEHAEKLRPLLKAANRFKGSSQAQPSATYAPGTKDAIYDFNEANPGKRRKGIGWYITPGMRWAALAIVLVIALLFTVTAYAQTSFPGDALYILKLGSEDVVRIVSPLQVDLYLSHRRVGEVLAVRNDPKRMAIAWAEYKLVMERLMAYKEPTLKDKIQGILRAEWDELVQAGVPLPTGKAALPPIPTVTPTPLVTGTPLPPGAPTGQIPTATPTPGSIIGPAATATHGSLPSFKSPTPQATWTSQATWTPHPTWTSAPTQATWTPFPTISFPTPKCPTWPICP